MENSNKSSSEPSGMRSLGAVLFVQAQNALNDNFVRFVLMGLVMAVASGTVLGDKIQFILSILITLPFILLAPIAGYFSDRFSKQSVIWWCAVAQFWLFVFIGGCVWFRQIEFAIVGFFLLAVQSTIFSPAKQGILKEIVGTQKLGFANGLLSMLTMVGILAGMIFSGRWFDHLLRGYNEASGVNSENVWKAALIPILGIGLFSLTALIGTKMIQKTPEHPSEKFSRSIWVRHFVHLRQLFQQPILRRTALFITAYWFIANSLFFFFVAFAKKIYPNVQQAGLSSAIGEMMVAVGGGLIIGSLLVSFISRKRIILKLCIFGAFGMALGLLAVGIVEPGITLWYGCLGVIGFSSAFYIVPLNAHLQDQADPESRGRVISAMNLMTSIAAVIATGIGIVLDLKLEPSQQVLVFVVPTVLVGIFITLAQKSLPVA